MILSSGSFGADSFPRTVQPLNTYRWMQEALMLPVVDELHPLQTTTSVRTMADRWGAELHPRPLQSIHDANVIVLSRNELDDLKKQALLYNPNLKDALALIQKIVFKPQASLPGASTLVRDNDAAGYRLELDQTYITLGRELALLMHLTADAAELAAVGSRVDQGVASLEGDVAGLLAQGRLYYGLGRKNRAILRQIGDHFDKDPNLSSQPKRYEPILTFYDQAKDLAGLSQQVLDGRVQTFLTTRYSFYTGQTLTAVQRTKLVSRFGRMPSIRKSSVVQRPAPSNETVAPLTVDPAGLLSEAVGHAQNLKESLAYPTLMKMAQLLERHGYDPAAYHVLELASRLLPDDDPDGTIPSLALAYQARNALRNGHSGLAERKFTRAFGEARKYQQEGRTPIVGVINAMIDAWTLDPQSGWLVRALVFATRIPFDNDAMAGIIRHLIVGHHWARAKELLHVMSSSPTADSETSPKKVLSATLACALSRAGQYKESLRYARASADHVEILLTEVRRLRQTLHFREALQLVNVLESWRAKQEKTLASERILSTEFEPDIRVRYEIAAIQASLMMAGLTKNTQDYDTAIEGLAQAGLFFPDQLPSAYAHLAVLLAQSGRQDLAQHLFELATKAAELLKSGQGVTPWLMISKAQTDAGFTVDALATLQRLPTSPARALAQGHAALKLALTDRPAAQREFENALQELTTASTGAVAQDFMNLATLEFQAGFLDLAKTNMDRALQDASLFDAFALLKLANPLIEQGRQDALIALITTTLERFYADRSKRFKNQIGVNPIATQALVDVVRVVSNHFLSENDFVTGLLLIRSLLLLDRGHELLVEVAMAAAHYYSLPLTGQGLASVKKQNAVPKRPLVTFPEKSQAVLEDTFYGRLFWNARGMSIYRNRPELEQADGIEFRETIEALWKSGRLKAPSLDSIFDGLDTDLKIAEFISAEVAPWLEVEDLMTMFKDIWPVWNSPQFFNKSITTVQAVGYRTEKARSEHYITFKGRHPYAIAEAHCEFYNTGVHFLAAALSSKFDQPGALVLLKQALVEVHRQWNTSHPDEPAVASFQTSSLMHSHVSFRSPTFDEKMEQDVVTLVRRGLSAKDIASKLGKSKVYIQQLMWKVYGKTRTSASPSLKTSA